VDSLAHVTKNGKEETKTRWPVVSPNPNSMKAVQ